MKRLIWLGILGALMACGGGNSSSGIPLAPTPSFPAVAGAYSGSATFSYPTLSASFTCGASTTVTQSGEEVSIAPVTLGGSGACANLGSIPIGSGTIDATGSMGSASQNNVYLAQCNGYYNGAAGGGFYGDQLRFSATFTPTSGACVTNPGYFSIAATLTRQ